MFFLFNHHHHPFRYIFRCLFVYTFSLLYRKCNLEKFCCRVISELQPDFTNQAVTLVIEDASKKW